MPALKRKPLGEGDSYPDLVMRAFDSLPAAEMGIEPAPADADRTCPTCEGECVIDDCPEDTCVCGDPPCAERACPDCGGIGTV